MRTINTNFKKPRAVIVQSGGHNMNIWFMCLPYIAYLHYVQRANGVVLSIWRMNAHETPPPPEDCAHIYPLSVKVEG